MATSMMLVLLMLSTMFILTEAIKFRKGNVSNNSSAATPSSSSSTSNGPIGGLAPFTKIDLSSEQPQVNTANATANANQFVSGGSTFRNINVRGPTFNGRIQNSNVNAGVTVTGGSMYNRSYGDGSNSTTFSNFTSADGTTFSNFNIGGRAFVGDIRNDNGVVSRDGVYVNNGTGTSGASTKCTVKVYIRYGEQHSISIEPANWGEYIGQPSVDNDTLRVKVKSNAGGATIKITVAMKQVVQLVTSALSGFYTVGDERIVTDRLDVQLRSRNAEANLKVKANHVDFTLDGRTTNSTLDLDAREVIGKFTGKETSAKIIMWNTNRMEIDVQGRDCKMEIASKEGTKVTAFKYTLGDRGARINASKVVTDGGDATLNERDNRLTVDARGKPVNLWMDGRYNYFEHNRAIVSVKQYSGRDNSVVSL